MKPRISKKSGKWVVDVPSFGFNFPQQHVSDTWKDAVSWVLMRQLSGSSSSTPEVAWMSDADTFHTGFRPIVR